jgi:2-polyprenyl-3-methyl-5-hydroxy-6-metoxy-1,4-benzoquinol methylase
VFKGNDIGAGSESRSGLVRTRLLPRIQRRYRVLTETVRVGPLAFPFTRIEDPNRVLDEVAAEETRLEKEKGQRVHEDQLHLPYWAELWDSAMGMGQFLVKGSGEGSGLRVQGSGRNAEEPLPLNPELSTLNPLSVLDLGCGMGLSGTVAATLGHSVLFADLEAPALLFARLNSLEHGERVRARRLDWRKDRLGERFDLILGADILYERKQWDHLEPFWRAHLKETGSVLLGEPGRKTGEMFVEWIAARGWKLEEFAEPVETRSRPIRLFRLSLGTSGKPAG